VLRKNFTWIILVIGLMINNIGLATIIGESFEKSLVAQDNLYEESNISKETNLALERGEQSIDIILPDEEIPGGKAVRKDNQKMFGYEVYLAGLTLTLIGLGVRKKEIFKK